MMLDEPGSFYICTETSPRCFVIQKVRAKDLPKVCDELGVGNLDDVDCASSPRRSSDFDGKTVTVSQKGEGGGNAPSALLPYWWDEDSKQKLDACAPVTCTYSANGEEGEEYNGVPVYDQQQMTPVVAVNDGYEVQLSVMQDGSCEFVADASGSHHDYVSPSAASEQQLRVNVDQFPGYSSVMSSPSEDRPLAAAGVQQLDSTDDGQGGKWAPPSPGTALDLSYDELKTRVRHQLEYYFSRENLAADAYLRSQMDNDQFVKVTTLASFNMVKRLTTDLSLILLALRESPVLQLNEAGDKVRPIHKRCTLILREIPEGTKKEEVEEMFSSPQCPKIVSSEYALNNIWYVNFETDEDAQKAFLYLRQKVQCFKGKPILARIKTAPIPRVQQNGSRPTPPNTLPLQNMPYPAISPSPNVVVSGSSQIMLSPADSATFASPGAPFSTASGPVAFSTTPVDNAATPDAVMAMPAASPVYFYPGGHSPSLVPSTGVMAAPPSAIMNSTSWPPTNPNTFDLGYILAMNGYQAQGAYRPAVYVPAPPPISPACHIGTVAGPRFPGDRSMRKPRTGSYPSHHHQPIDRTGAQSADSGRPPPSYNRYGSTSGARSANGNNGGMGGGYYGDRKGSPYWKHDQNIHYNNIRSRPNRYALNGNYAGNGSGMNNYGPSHDNRPRYPSRSDRGGRYSGSADNWNMGGYQPKPHRKQPVTPTTGGASATTATTSAAIAGSGVQDKKAEDSFDLHSSSFPPLPTATTTAGIDEAEVEIDKGQDGHTEKKESSSAATSQSQQPTHILQREHNEQHSASSLVVKVQPRMKQTTSTENTPASNPQAQSTSIATAKGNDGIKEPVTNDHKPDHAIMASTVTAAQKVAHGVSATRPSGVTVPVAVVQPSAQQKPLKVATADKATATDLSPPTVRSTVMMENDALFSKSVSIDTKCEEDKTGSDPGKKLSYADMAKHAAANRGGTTAAPLLLATSPPIPAQKSAVSVTSTGSSGGTGNSLANGKDQAGIRRQQTERGKLTTSRDSEGEEEDGDVQYRRVKNKYAGTLRKSPKQYHGSDGQQDQPEVGMQVPSSSY